VAAVIRWKRDTAVCERGSFFIARSRFACQSQRRVNFFTIIICLLVGVGGAAAQTTEQLFLSGHGKDDAVPWRFFCTSGAHSGVWTNLPVPSNWDVRGFGTLNYKKDATNPPPEQGRYETDFYAPTSWTNQRAFLVFEGVMTDTRASLNGQSVGAVHQGGFYRFSYEVTPLLKLGATNLLSVEVAKHSANESVNKAERLADFWVFGGIYRPVHLDIVPQQYIERVAIDARADGTFTAQVCLGGLSNAWEVVAQLQTLDGQNVGGPFSNMVAASGAGNNSVKVSTKISPQLWSAESPHLYQVEVRLMRGTEVVHRVTQRFGFRTFEVRDGDGLYLNGSKLILKGVNRHSFWPDSGRCLSEAVHRLDITTIKGMNANAVRMAHYPPDAEFLDLCDELGLYVLDELTGWHNHYDNTVGANLVREMVVRDVNHPSILFWDNGNEGGFNTNLDKLFANYDPQQRRVLHPWATFSGLCTAHYLAYDKAAIAASGQRVFFQAPDKELVATNDHTKYIYMPTEFQHALYDGGGGAALGDYWRMMMSHSNCAGGFIWTFTDDAIRRPDTGELDTAGNQAPDGVVGPYREREASYYAIKEIWAEPKKATGKDTEVVKKWPWPRTNSAQQVSSSKKPSMYWTEQKNFLMLQSGALAAAFDKRTGLLTKLRYLGNIIPLANGPRPTDGRATLKNISVEKKQDAIVVTATYAGSLQEVGWHFATSGALRCEYRGSFSGTNDTIGVAFDYPEASVRAKRWLGDGPFRVWKNRLEGNTFGVWSNAYNNTITGARGWEYPEFKGCFAHVRWLQLDTTDGWLTVVPENVPYLQVLTPAQPPDKLVAKTRVNLPPCGLAFLQAIPPIGSKFKAAAQLGPQSQSNIGRGTYSGAVTFYFGARTLEE
jgi:hypothetical protein